MRADRASGTSTSPRPGSTTSSVSRTWVTVLRSPPISRTRISSARGAARVTSISVQADGPAGGRTAPRSNCPRPPRGAASAPGRMRTGLVTRACRWMTPRCQAKTVRSTTPPSMAARRAGSPRCCWIVHWGRRATRRTVAAAGWPHAGSDELPPIAASSPNAHRRRAVSPIVRSLSGRPSVESRRKKNAPGGHPPGA